MTIAIIKYNAGNVCSVEFGLQRLGLTAIVTDDPEEILSADKIIFPGVGAAGVAQQPNVFYIGVNNGGVWKTTDYGRTWFPIFDDQPTGSIGDIAVAPSNPNVTIQEAPRVV